MGTMNTMTVKCPQCDEPALSLFQWILHELYQPVWKQNRYHCSCRNCKAELEPAKGEVLRSFVIPVVGAVSGVALANFLGQSEGIWIAIGIGLGVLVHYPLAQYAASFPHRTPTVPTAKVKPGSHRY